ncbi:hypothetical protein N8D56_02570 [Devosia sp. A8/3-2]|nr:hypothetical protein N8D56_02570 [Devosia sp. A8/3-2]
MLIRVAPLIAELETDQWLVSHHEERHAPAVRRGRSYRQADGRARAAVPG